MTLSDLFKNQAPVFLSPMAGVTDAPFREAVCSLGASAVVTEMISSEALVRNSGKTLRRLAGNGKNSLKIVQIMGADPHRMAESAVINEGLGADVIDINFGCPIRKVVANGSGAALLKNEGFALQIAESVVKSVKIPVTVKMRLGWDSEHINCLSLARKLETAGVSMLTIHCRSRSQMYRGKADWSRIKELKNILKIPYLCNGDVKSGDDALLALKESGAAGISIGRGALGRPWLLKQVMELVQCGRVVPDPGPTHQHRIVLNHFQSTLDFYGEQHGIRIFRKHFGWYSKGMNGSSAFREVINRAENIGFIKNYLEDFYEQRFRDILGERKKQQNAQY
ncbi:MAG: tRNA dihydrouridine synthase DusB [Holosporaceae bacterium]|jgi:tRNA-dihydrouridine synthase B|nr:tRNA dihydrouridine synthase DusB [Holosporaceae bacterium]